MAQASNPPLF
jgi:hypothetical protein